MELVKQKLNEMKNDYEVSEDRIVKFQAELQNSKRNLETAVKEKESLSRRIEVVESQVINADKQRQEIMEQLKYLERNTDQNEGKRRFLENREMEGDQTITKLEERLGEVREKFFENSVKCEEGERRLAVLKAEFDKIHTKRAELEEQARWMQQEVDDKTFRLRDLEERELKNSARDFRNEDHMKLVNDYYRDAADREEEGRFKVQRLQRQIEEAEDQIELVQKRKRKTEVEFKNTVQAVMNN